MAPPKGKKRARDGSQKTSSASNTQSSNPLNDTPPCGQRVKELTTSSATVPEPTSSHADSSPNIPKPTSSKHPRANTDTQPKQKRPRLPENATIFKRALFRPAIPSPFSNASSPKIVYIKTHSPFIPAVKRVRSLLHEIERRHRQSLAAQKSKGLGSRDPLTSNGRLDPRVVERAIAEGSAGATAAAAAAGGRGRKNGIIEEEVFVKATGKAIPRALSIGNWFQKEADCAVRVELGSTKAIDDIDVVDQAKEEGEAEAEAEAEAMDVDGPAIEDKGKKVAEDEIPETRIRTLSTVTVAISLR